MDRITFTKYKKILFVRKIFLRIKNYLMQSSKYQHFSLTLSKKQRTDYYFHTG